MLALKANFPKPSLRGQRNYSKLRNPSRLCRQTKLQFIVDFQLHCRFCTTSTSQYGKRRKN